MAKKAEVVPRDEVVRKETENAKEQIEGGYADLAQLLHETWENAYYVKWGYDSFREYTEDELGLNYRKARYYVTIAQVVKRLKIPWVDIREIGWTKMRALVPILNEDNVADWLERAANNTVEVLEESVKDFKEIERVGEDKKPVALKLRLSQDAASIVLDSIEKAKKMIETESVEMAIEHICYQWYMENDEDPQEVTLESVQSWVERKFGVKLVPESPQEIESMIQEDADAE